MTSSVVSEGRLGLKFESIRPKIHRNRSMNSEIRFSQNASTFLLLTSNRTDYHGVRAFEMGSIDRIYDYRLVTTHHIYTNSDVNNES